MNNATADRRTATTGATQTEVSSEKSRNGNDRAARLLAALVLTTVTIGIYGTIAAGRVRGSGDYRAHILLAKTFYESGKLPAPHFLLHALIAGMFAARLAPSLDAACIILLAGCYGATALMLYRLFWSSQHNFQHGKPAAVFLLSLALLVAQPITLSHAYQLGYFWLEPYSIPTSILLKPFALAGFVLTACCLSGREIHKGAIVGLAAVTVAGALSKPSFLICVLPAAAVLSIFRLYRKSPISWRALLLGLFIPSLAVLGWQFHQTYSGTEAALAYHDTIILAPLKVMNLYTTNLLAKLLLSILFPLTVTVACWRQARRSVMLQLGWSVFSFGAAYTYLLAERDHWRSGNFFWSAYIATFVLFTASVLVFGEAVKANSSSRWRVLLCGAVLALHVACGARMDWLYLTHYSCPENFRLVEFVCPAQSQRP